MVAARADLADVTAPGAAAAVAQKDAVVIRKTTNRIALGVAEAVVEGVVAVDVYGPQPHIAVLVAEPDEIGVSEALGGFSAAVQMVETDREPVSPSFATVDH